MSRTISPLMTQLLNSDGIAALATFWKITRKDGQEFGFTDWTANVRFGTTIYEASTGLTKSALQQRVDLAVPNQEISGILTSDAIKAAELRAGMFNGARIESFMAVPTDPDFLNYGRILLPGAFLGEVTIQDGMFMFEVRGLSYRLTQSFIELYGPLCRAEFCDAQCSLSITNFTSAGSVSAVPTQNFTFSSTDISGPGEFSALPESGKKYQFGLVTFTSGQNNGYAAEVVDQSEGPWTAELYLPTPYPISPGDTFTAVVGCDKTFVRCVQFLNSINFRGEPFIPGMQLLFDVGIVAP